MTVKILLDPGHAAGSAHNRGYIGTKWKNEGDGNYNFSLLLRKELESYGIIVGTTRTSNTTYDKPVDVRGREGVGYDALISLHTNAGKGTGVEIFNGIKKSGGLVLATNLTDTISSTLGINNRGVKYCYINGSSRVFSSTYPTGKTDYFGVLRENGAKIGMLIEHCFHDNFTDVSKYENNAETLAKNMAKTIAEYYKLENEGDDFMSKFGGLPPMVISVTNEMMKDDDYINALASFRRKFYPSYNPAITVSGDFDYTNLKGKLMYIVGFGGVKGNHTSSINYFVPGTNGKELLETVKDIRSKSIQNFRDTYKV